MKKICHMTCVHKRYDTRIFMHECKSLADNGFDVSLIVADGKGNEEKDGVKIYDIGSNNVSRWKRMTRIANLVKQKAIELDCEVYHFHDPELMFVGLALYRKGKKVIVDMHEDHPSYIAEADYIPLPKIVSFLYEKLENYAVKRFAGVITTRQVINDRLGKYNRNIQMITNYPILSTDYKEHDSSDGTYVIAFAGAVVDSWRHKLIIQAIENINNVKYLLAGPVSDSYLDTLKSLKGWSKVEYLGEVPYSKVCEMYENASMGIAVYHYCNNMGGTEGNLANTKMFEFMNFGLPFICTDFRLWKQIVEKDEKCGICVNPYNQEEITKAIEYLVTHTEERKQMGINSRNAAVTKYNWERQEKLLVGFYNKILKGVNAYE